MDNKNNGAILVFGLIGVGLLFLFLGKRQPYYQPTYQPEFNVIRLGESQSQGVSAANDGGKHYRNKETRNIEYNEDGLPTKIEIIRDFKVG